MKVLFTIIALMIPSLAFADMFAGAEVGYTPKHNSTSFGLYGGKAFSDNLAAQVSVSVIDQNSLFTSPYTYQGDASLVASMKIGPFTPSIEGGIEYTVQNGDNNDSLFAAAALDFNVGPAVLSGEIKTYGTSFKNEVVSMSLKYPF